MLITLTGQKQEKWLLPIPAEAKLMANLVG